MDPVDPDSDPEHCCTQNKTRHVFAEFPATFCGVISASDPDSTFHEVLDSDPTPEQGRVKTEKDSITGLSL